MNRFDDTNVPEDYSEDESRYSFDPLGDFGHGTSDDERHTRDVLKDLEKMNEPEYHEPREVLDILNFEADEIIQPMKIDEYLAQFKEHATNRASLYESSGEMFRYQ